MWRMDLDARLSSASRALPHLSPCDELVRHSVVGCVYPT